MYFLYISFLIYPHTEYRIVFINNISFIILRIGV